MRQIRIAPEGLWHRPARGDLKHTACGMAITGAVAHRDHRDGNHLCPVCWTPHELDTGEMKKLERDLEREHPDQYFDENEEPTNPDGEEK